MNQAENSDAILCGMALPEERQAALKLLVSARFGDIDTDRWWSQLADQAATGLIVARQHGAVVGATWAQPIMSGIASLWTPVTSLEKQSVSQSARAALLKQLEAYLIESPVELGRALIPVDDSVREIQLQSIGCETITIIESMYWPVEVKEHHTNDPRLQYEPSALDDLARLESVMSRTYAGSLDCIKVRKVIGAKRVLESYAAAPNADSSLWFIATFEGKDAGCVILADDEEGEQCELMYMGIAPEFRGQGLGAELLSHAQQVAVRKKRRRLTVAVDEDNEPAVALYDAAGFVPFSHMRLIGRVFT